MQYVTLIFAAVLVCSCAQVSMPPDYAKRYPEDYKYSKIARHARELSWKRTLGNGHLFGTVGSNDDELFGRCGYKQDIFNDHRGKLQGQAYGSRIIGSYGDSSSFGGKLDWSNDNARLGAGIHREIGGRSGLRVTGEGVWNLDKDTKFSAGGNLQKTFGHERPEIGVQGKIEHRF